MKKIIWLIATQLLFSIGVITANNANGYFHRVGNEIISPSGKPYLIKGVNVSCWLYQENYVLGGAQTAQKVTSAKLKRLLGEEGYHNYIKNMMANFLTPADLEHMRKMGINSVRLGSMPIYGTKRKHVSCFTIPLIKYCQRSKQMN